MSRIAAEEYLESLAAHGIEHLFVNPGTDFAPVVGLVRTQSARSTNRPDASSGWCTCMRMRSVK